MMVVVEWNGMMVVVVEWNRMMVVVVVEWKDGGGME